MRSLSNYCDHEGLKALHNEAGIIALETLLQDETYEKHRVESKYMTWRDEK